MNDPKSDYCYCSECIFFIPMKKQTRKDTEIGNCVVNSPTPDSNGGVGKFPITISTMWCGQSLRVDVPVIKSILEGLLPLK